MLQQPIRWAEWSFTCCNNLFGGQNGLLHVATTHSVGRMVFYMLQQPIRWAEWSFTCCNNPFGGPEWAFALLQQPIRWAEWGFTWLQHNFVRVQTFVASLGRPFRRGRTVVFPTFRPCVISRWNGRGTMRIALCLRWD